MGTEEPLDGCVSLGQGVRKLTGNNFFGNGVVLSDLFSERDELEVSDVKVSCYHVLNF